MTSAPMFDGKLGVSPEVREVKLALVDIGACDRIGRLSPWPRFLWPHSDRTTKEVNSPLTVAGKRRRTNFELASSHRPGTSEGWPSRSAW